MKEARGSNSARARPRDRESIKANLEKYAKATSDSTVKSTLPYQEQGHTCRRAKQVLSGVVQTIVITVSREVEIEEIRERERMEGVTHRTVAVNGINMHVAEKGEGRDVVLFVHGFPELWYTWRHQMAGLAEHGYRCVAPDLRGYGDTDVPEGASSYTIFQLVGDVVALIDSLGVKEVFLVAHDWGAVVAWHVCLFRPDKVRALVALSMPFRSWPWDCKEKPVDYFRSRLGDDFYVCRFQEPGAVEAELACISNKLVMKKFRMSGQGKPLIVPKNPGFGALPDCEIVLPSWLTEEDVAYYASKFDKTGYTGALNYYRALDASAELLAPFKGAQVKVPAKFIVGDKDLAYNFPGYKEYIHDGGFQEDVPLLDEVVVMEGVSHFINQEKPDEITQHIYDFIMKF